MAKATQKVIKKRLRSIGNTQKIARAMEMVAAAKRRRAEEMALTSRPYTAELMVVLHGLITELGRDLDHPLLKEVKVKRTGLILVTTDKGLTGKMQAESLRCLLREIAAQREAGNEIELFTLGRKGTNFALRAGLTIRAQFPKEMENYSVEHVYPLSHLIIQDYLAKRYSQVRVVYTEFISALRQAAKVFTLLPLRLTEAIPATVRGAAARPAASPVRNKTEFSYEPSAQVLLDELLPSYIRARLYWSLLEVNASEHAARMLAMHSAAENAAAMMSELQLEYNQLRQLSITQELAEIMGGLAALK